jgi:hypothetical protein
MLDISLFFISNHHTMHERHVPERQAHVREAMSTRDIALAAPATPDDEPKRRGLCRMIGMMCWPIR